MEPSQQRRYRGLSPFELKNALLELAKHRGERMMLNAGRGNPNWIALAPRAAFFRLGQFAVAEARQCTLAPDFGGLPKKRGIAHRLRAFLDQQPDAPGNALLTRGIDYAHQAHGIDPDLLAGEWVDGVLGDHYPSPVRMLMHAEQLVRAHLIEELFGGDPRPVASICSRSRARAPESPTCSSRSCTHACSRPGTTSHSASRSFPPTWRFPGCPSIASRS